MTRTFNSVSMFILCSVIFTNVAHANLFSRACEEVLVPSLKFGESLLSSNPTEADIKALPWDIRARQSKDSEISSIQARLAIVEYLRLEYTVQWNQKNPGSSTLVKHWDKKFLEDVTPLNDHERQILEKFASGELQVKFNSQTGEVAFSVSAISYKLDSTAFHQIFEPLLRKIWDRSLILKRLQADYTATKQQDQQKPTESTPSLWARFTQKVRRSARMLIGKPPVEFKNVNQFIAELSLIPELGKKHNEEELIKSFDHYGELSSKILKTNKRAKAMERCLEHLPPLTFDEVFKIIESFKDPWGRSLVTDMFFHWQPAIRAGDFSMYDPSYFIPRLYKLADSAKAKNGAKIPSLWEALARAIPSRSIFSVEESSALARENPEALEWWSQVTKFKDSQSSVNSKRRSL